MCLCFHSRPSFDLEDPLGIREVLLQERILQREVGCSQVRLSPGPVPTPLQPHFPPHTHIKGLTKGIIAAKDRVGDRNQGWAGPFLPWGEVIIGIIFCLEEEL